MLGELPPSERKRVIQMPSEAVPNATRRLLDYLAELGPRWGLPAIPCRVHGYMYLEARAVSEAELCRAAGIDVPELQDAIRWLIDFRLAEQTAPGVWRTNSDPWTLMLHALEERRKREFGPALDLLRECRRESLHEGRNGGNVSLQIGKLLALVEDLAAIDMQASRLSPESLRQFIRIGGRAARFLDRRFGKGA